MRFSLSPGKRLRYFRILRSMTQKQLGMAIGFSEQTADVRIAQYELGARTPKEQTVTALAKVLAVSPNALSIPQIESEGAFMHLLFALEDSYGVTLECASDTGLEKAFSQWRQMTAKQRNGDITKEEYDEWRFLFGG